MTYGQLQAPLSEYYSWEVSAPKGSYCDGALGGDKTKALLYIYTPDIQDQDNATPDLGSDIGRNHINSLIEQVKPKVVFIDNIDTFVRTGNENEADSWAPVQEWLIQLRKRGIAVVVVHHVNKEGKQRGSHKNEDMMDVVIQLRRPDDYIAGEDATVCSLGIRRRGT